MSIQALAWVLEHSHAEGTDRLVLLAIANHADSRGANAWPHVDQIAFEARVHRATVFRALTALQALGELEVLKAGGGRGNRNHYQLTMKPSQGATLWLERKTVAGCDVTVAETPETVAGCDKNGRTGATQNRPEPSKAFDGDRPADPKGPAAAEHQPWRIPPLTDEDRQRGRSRLHDLLRRTEDAP